MCGWHDKVKGGGSLSLVTSGWSLAALATITWLVTWTAIERYQDPVREKYVLPMPPGNADFFLAFAGTRAFLAGVNPYVNDLPGLDDPWNRGFQFIWGKPYKSTYPPTHHLIYLPLALVTTDYREAGRILFVVNVAALFLLSVLTWWLLVQGMNLTGGERRPSAILMLLSFAILAGNVATGYALERGDGGDILAAALCWSAVVLFVKQWHFLSMFLMIPAMFIKGYPVWCGLGLGLLSLNGRTWVRTIGGVVAGLLVFLLPVAKYLPEGIDVVLTRPDFGGQVLWWNHGFWNLFYHVSPDLADIGRWGLGGYCAVLSVLCWIKARQALGQGDTYEGTLWMVFFVTCSIELMLGLSRTSLVYNLILVMPGMLLFCLLAPAFGKANGFPSWFVHLLGTVTLLSMFFVFKFVLLDWASFPSTGIGMVLFLIAVGLFMGGTWRFAAHTSKIPNTYLRRVSQTG